MARFRPQSVLVLCCFTFAAGLAVTALLTLDARKPPAEGPAALADRAHELATRLADAVQSATNDARAARVMYNLTRERGSAAASPECSKLAQRADRLEQAAVSWTGLQGELARLDSELRRQRELPEPEAAEVERLAAALAELQRRAALVHRTTR